MNKSLSEVLSEIKRFRDERNWMQFHNPKDMTISITIEAAELLEHFQWKSAMEVEEYVGSDKGVAAVSEEIADIGIYLLELADNLGIDLVEAMLAKIKKNAAKYPADKARDSHAKYDTYR